LTKHQVVPSGSGQAAQQLVLILRIWS